MNTSKTPNQDALYHALKIYRASMRTFIFQSLKAVPGLLRAEKFQNETDFDINHFPHLVRNHWSKVFKHRFDGNRDIRGAVSIITEARNKVSHPGAEDLSLEYALARLYEIADILGQIKAPRQKAEVEAIRAKLLPAPTVDPKPEPKLPRRKISKNIQTERKPKAEYSEFWEPIRQGKFGELFSGKSVLIRNDGYISKTIRGVQVCLYLTNHQCYIQLWIPGGNKLERRDKVKELLLQSNYEYEDKDTEKSASLIFPVLDKGRKDRDAWPEMRERLVSMGTDIYNKINESDL